MIERPPKLYRWLFPGTVWRRPSKDGRKRVYLTFDDGPIPRVTPFVLDLLLQHDIRALFFCVADNVRKHPDVFEQVLSHGHLVGNHTYHHIQGIQNNTEQYMRDVQAADELLHTRFFRPPHGHLKWGQLRRLKEHYTVVMWDLVTRDYSRFMTPERTLENVRKYVRDGSVIVFHDSLKAEKNMTYALPRAIDYLKKEGYVFGDPADLLNP